MELNEKEKETWKLLQEVDLPAKSLRLAQEAKQTALDAANLAEATVNSLQDAPASVSRLAPQAVATSLSQPILRPFKRAPPEIGPREEARAMGRAEFLREKKRINAVEKQGTKHERQEQIEGPSKSHKKLTNAEMTAESEQILADIKKERLRANKIHEDLKEVEKQFKLRYQKAKGNDAPPNVFFYPRSVPPVGPREEEPMASYIEPKRHRDNPRHTPHPREHEPAPPLIEPKRHRDNPRHTPHPREHEPMASYIEPKRERDTPRHTHHPREHTPMPSLTEPPSKPSFPAFDSWEKLQANLKKFEEEEEEISQRKFEQRKKERLQKEALKQSEGNFQDAIKKAFNVAPSEPQKKKLSAKDQTITELMLGPARRAINYADRVATNALQEEFESGNRRKADTTLLQSSFSKLEEERINAALAANGPDVPYKAPIRDRRVGEYHTVPMEEAARSAQASLDTKNEKYLRKLEEEVEKKQDETYIGHDDDPEFPDAPTFIGVDGNAPPEVIIEPIEYASEVPRDEDSEASVIQHHPFGLPDDLPADEMRAPSRKPRETEPLEVGDLEYMKKLFGIPVKHTPKPSHPPKPAPPMLSAHSPETLHSRHHPNRRQAFVTSDELTSEMEPPGHATTKRNAKIKKEKQKEKKKPGRKPGPKKAKPPKKSPPKKKTPAKKATRKRKANPLEHILRGPLLPGSFVAERGNSITRGMDAPEKRQRIQAQPKEVPPIQPAKKPPPKKEPKKTTKTYKKQSKKTVPVTKKPTPAKVKKAIGKKKVEKDPCASLKRRIALLTSKLQSLNKEEAVAASGIKRVLRTRTKC